MIREVLSECGRFNALPVGDPSIGRICPGCYTPIRAGDLVTLVNPSPPEPDDVGKGAYNAEVEVAHETCAYVNGEPVTPCTGKP